MNDIEFTAYNIVNQLADFYSKRIPSHKWVDVRQATNDQLWATPGDALRAHDAEVWDEGAQAVRDRMDEFRDREMDDPENPYRAKAIREQKGDNA